MNRWSVALLSFTLAGCAAHATMRGSVVMKVNDTEVHVCLGVGEVKEGQTIKLFRNVCTQGVGGGPKGSIPVAVCKKEPAGQGTVEKVLNEHYSVVRFAAGTSVNEGDTVESVR